ncbi:MFS transporter [uncultured Methanospirillum sp.]|uniref:MFS transporter n=1 Tax=uncultured Methanospirillum sp. TaxID=262503 RepID=UPI0029C8E6E6|nr:MFS transporter [uncultured Methanospirillum sp.]
MGDHSEVQYDDKVIRKITLHILPFILILYIINYIDRVNLGFAALTMNQDLGITPVIFGLASGVFFIGYIICEYPSNRMMERVGAKIWIPRILISWGIVVVLLSLARSAYDVGALRLLLGAAEAGFYPGIVLYLSFWFPSRELGRSLSYLYAAQIVALIIGAPLSTLILDHVTWLGLASWRWVFILEGVPAIILGIIAYRYIINRPEDAPWLSTEEKTSLVSTLRAERESKGVPARRTLSFFFGQIWFHRIWVAYFFEMCAGYAIIFWLPQIIRSFHFNSSNTETGLISSIPYVFALIGMFLWAKHSDRTGERKYHLYIPWICASIGLFVDAFVKDPISSLVFLTVAMTGLYAAIPVFWAIVTDRMKQIDASGGIALVNALATIGGFIGPSLMGFFVSSSGEIDAVPALFTFSGFLLLSVVLMAWEFHAMGNASIQGEEMRS